MTNQQTKMTDTATVSELQESNKKLRDKIQQLEDDYLSIARTLDDITTIQLSDIRNLLKLLPSITKGEQRATVLNALHAILDELENDVQLIIQDGIDELNERYIVSAVKVLRGGEDI